MSDLLRFRCEKCGRVVALSPDDVTVKEYEGRQVAHMDVGPVDDPIACPFHLDSTYWLEPDAPANRERAEFDGRTVGCVDCQADTTFDTPVTTPWACDQCGRRYIGPVPPYGRPAVPRHARRATPTPEAQS